MVEHPSLDAALRLDVEPGVSTNGLFVTDRQLRARRESREPVRVRVRGAAHVQPDRAHNPDGAAGAAFRDFGHLCPRAGGRVAAGWGIDVAGPGCSQPESHDRQPYNRRHITSWRM